MTDRLARAIAAVDAANAGAPETILVDGQRRPKELAHAEMMTDWVRRLDPEADETQLLAARAHHLRRWTILRTDYPEGRAGYLRWRTYARRRHAEEMGRILAEVGYEPETIERVGQIIRKENLRSDPQVQTHEDALCLVFLETQLAETAEELGDEKIVTVLAKTWAKMSEPARRAALDLDLSASERSLLERALQDPAPQS